MRGWIHDKTSEGGSGVGGATLITKADARKGRRNGAPIARPRSSAFNCHNALAPCWRAMAIASESECRPAITGSRVCASSKSKPAANEPRNNKSPVCGLKMVAATARLPSTFGEGHLPCGGSTKDGWTLTRANRPPLFNSAQSRSPERDVQPAPLNPKLSLNRVHRSTRGTPHERGRLCRPVQFPRRAKCDNRRMFVAAPGDVILQASIDGAFMVIDATSLVRVPGPLPLQTALAYARDHGAPYIFQQALDTRGRLIGDPRRFRDF